MLWFVSNVSALSIVNLEWTVQHVINSCLKFSFRNMKKFLFNYKNGSKLLYERCLRYSQGTPIVFKLKLESEQAKLNDLFCESLKADELKQKQIWEKDLYKKWLTLSDEKVLKRYSLALTWIRNIEMVGICTCIYFGFH